MNSLDRFNEKVKESVESGVEQLKLELIPIVDLDDGEPIAYRCKVLVNSIIEGTLKEVDYSYVSDVRDVGVDLLKHSIKYIVKAYRALQKAEKEILFLSLRCPAQLIERVSLHDTVKSVLDLYPWFDPKVLCLEFDERILHIDSSKAKEALLDMKLLKVKTAIIGCGKEDFLISKLISINPDYVYLDKGFTAYAGSHNKPQLVTSMIEHMNSMFIDVIAEGEIKHRKALGTSNCVGFLDINADPVSLDEAIKEEGDDS